MSLFKLERVWEWNKQMSEFIPQMLVFYSYSEATLLLMKGNVPLTIR